MSGHVLAATRLSRASTGCDSNAIAVCTSRACILDGCDATLSAIEDLLALSPGPEVRLSKRSCLGNCGDGPNVTVGDVFFSRAAGATGAARVVDKARVGAKPLTKAEVDVVSARLDAEALAADDDAGALVAFDGALALAVECDAPDVFLAKIFAGRASLRLRSGDAAAALSDATAAIDLTPAGDHQRPARFVLAADATLATGRNGAGLYEAAVEAAARIEAAVGRRVCFKAAERRRVTLAASPA
ncbi:hypothetical protein M885DRAFT_520600 [Pelagophyceae sp. CCMP2097]|nr:hypothetical protein M885DRAFT_520600 [Pelagophyceae sp. CCMP2097]